ncbi:hypothetical protein HPB51_006984 [Rhipicephalus microplus]|uniref:Uncharacterized protein n=1 Tax=Rhipicephalus microplus TaxID=6941 RepID=A0A9J6D8N7_RHIMP|nr:hypothetical protein HPB51_006984 [Rhipicephalus microplus]
MPIRLPTLANRWGQAHRTCAALPTSTEVGAKDHFRRRSRVRAYSRRKNEASKGLAATYKDGEKLIPYHIITGGKDPCDVADELWNFAAKCSIKK